MEDFIQYMKRNIRYAAKNVFPKFFEFLPFFIALLVIQTSLYTVFITNSTNKQHQIDYLAEQYDYDIVIEDLTANEYGYINEHLDYQSMMKRRSFESYYAEQASVEEGGDYRFYVTLRDGTEISDFMSEHIEGFLKNPDQVTLKTSPRYEYQTSLSQAKEKTSLILLTVLLSALSVAAIIALYSVRINHNKFLYGIYSTFGANMKRLVTTSVFEMMLLSCLSLLISTPLSYLLALASYAKWDITPVLSLKTVVNVIVANFIIAILSSLLPMKLVASKTPLSLITSQDNANYVSSPRKSFNFLKKSFPRGYEMSSTWRYRKYYVKLLLSSILFCAVFICGAYVSHMYQQNLNSPILEFTVENRSHAALETQQDDMNFLYTTISEVEGVDYVSYHVSESATANNSFMLLSEEASNNSSGDKLPLIGLEPFPESMHDVYPSFHKQGYSSATNSFQYLYIDQNTITEYEERYRIEGDASRVLTDEKAVMINGDIFNDEKYSFKIGDTVLIARYVATEAPITASVFDTVGYLRNMLESNVYTFEEYTVAAILYDYDQSGKAFTVGMNAKAFEENTSLEPVPKSMDIHLESDISFDEANAVDDELTSLFYYMGEEYACDRTNAFTGRELNRHTSKQIFLYVLSSLVLLLCPVVWFFSQSMFFKKRKTELDVLRFFGAKESKIANVFKVLSIVLFVVAFVLTVLISIPVIFLIYKLMNQWLPSTGFVHSTLRYYFQIPPLALAVCAITSAICGWLSSMIPYKISCRMPNDINFKTKKEKHT